MLTMSVTNMMEQTQKVSEGERSKLRMEKEGKREEESL